MLHVYTSGRDYQPSVFWRDRLPADAVYVRVLVTAGSFDEAEGLLHAMGMGQYTDTLREAVPNDLPAGAVGHYAQQHCDGTTVFALYRVDTDARGERWEAPRFYVSLVLPTGPIHAIGRAQVVGMGRPTDPNPVARIVSVGDQDDPVPMPGDREGPIPATPPMQLAVPYPTGRGGDAVRLADERLPLGVAAVRDELTKVLAQIERGSLSADPIEASDRHSATLLSLVQKLAGLYADAQSVETALRNHT